jgi:hypothetical protein
MLHPKFYCCIPYYLSGLQAAIIIGNAAMSNRECKISEIQQQIMWNPVPNLFGCL